MNHKDIAKTVEQITNELYHVKRALTNAGEEMRKLRKVKEVREKDVFYYKSLAIAAAAAMTDTHPDLPPAFAGTVEQPSDSIISRLISLLTLNQGQAQTIKHLQGVTNKKLHERISDQEKTLKLRKEVIDQLESAHLAVLDSLGNLRTKAAEKDLEIGRLHGVINNQNRVTSAACIELGDMKKEVAERFNEIADLNKKIVRLRNPNCEDCARNGMTCFTPKSLLRCEDCTYYPGSSVCVICRDRSDFRHRSKLASIVKPPTIKGSK